MNKRLSAISSVYENMRSVGLVRSKADFSSRWLGQAGSYLTSMQARNRQPANTVPAKLALKLTLAILQQLDIGAHDGESRSRLIALGDALVGINACLASYSDTMSTSAAISTR